MLKIWEKVIEGRLRRFVQVSENQFGSMPGRSSTEAIHLMRQLTELHRDRKDLYMRKPMIEFRESCYGVVWRPRVFQVLIPGLLRICTRRL